MNMFDIARLLVKVKRFVPESARTRLCYMIADLIGNDIKKAGNEGSCADWQQYGARAFLQRCEVGDAPPAAVPANMCVRESLLSEFCNKWMNVTQFRAPGGEWMPVTSDMNSLRVTMVKELEEIANGGQKGSVSSDDGTV
jgi:hypothetical protein